MGNSIIAWGPKPLLERDLAKGNYDYWGYLPQTPLLKPSQHVWATYFWPDGQNRMNLNRNTRTGMYDWPQLYGIPETLLQGVTTQRFETTATIPLRWANLGGYPTEDNVYPSVQAGPGNGDGGPNWWPPGTEVINWTAQWVDEKKYGGPSPGQLPICNPENFPNCTMRPILHAENIFTDWANQEWKAGELWAQTIDNLYDKFYVNGNVDALSQINTQDTSAYDPCNKPGFLAQIGPILMGWISGGLFQKFLAADLRNTLSNNTMIAWGAGTFFIGYFLMRAALDVFGAEDTNLWWSSTSFAVPMGMTIGDYIISKGTANASPQVIYWVSVLGSMITIRPIAQRLLSLPAPLSFVLGLIGTIFTFIGDFVCRLTNPIPDACAVGKDSDPKDPERLFADARRWDAPSIAAKLTDEICSLEGWDRDDPRAEFAFKAFLTGPAMLDAARPPNSEQMPMWTVRGHGNPLGSIYEPVASQWISPNANEIQYGSQADSVAGWDGNVGGYWSIANHNSFACQNWEIMRFDEFAPELQTPEAQYVKDTFTKWIKSVRDAANVPGNLIHAGIGRETSAIPNWKDGRDAFEKLRAGWDRQQWLNFINGPVVNAKTFDARYALLGRLYDDVTEPKDQDVADWIWANQQAYGLLALKDDKGPSDVFKLFRGQLNLPTEDPRLSAWLYAVTATVEVDIASWWFNKSEEAIRTAMYKYDPPGNGLPFGSLKAVIVGPVTKLPPPVTHGHPSIPLGPVADPNSACAVNIANLRNAPSNLQNNSIANWLNIFDSVVNAPSSCKTCSLPHLNIAFGYKLAFEAARTQSVDNNYPGIGSVLAFLQGLGWSEQSMAAMVQELQVPIANQSEVNEWMGPGGPFWNRTPWNGTDYAPLLAKLRALDGHFDTTSNICKTETSLTPLPFWQGALAFLFTPQEERPAAFSLLVNPKGEDPGAYSSLFNPQDERPGAFSSLINPNNEPPDLRHVWYPEQPLPGLPQHIYWPTPPPTLKHTQAPPTWPPEDTWRVLKTLPGPPNTIYWPEEPPDLKHIWYPEQPLPGQPVHIYWPDPPSDLKHLHYADQPLPPGTGLEPLKPNQTIPGPEPTRLTLQPWEDACATMLQVIRNSTGFPPQYVNMSLPQVAQIIDQLRPADPCSQCNRQTYYEVWAYSAIAQAATAGPSTNIQTVGDFMYVTVVAGGWSNNAASAMLHTLKTPLIGQQPLTDYLDTFFSSTVSRFNDTDYSALYQLLMYLPGEWDNTFSGWCN